MIIITQRPSVVIIIKAITLLNIAAMQQFDMAAMRQEDEGDGCFCITTPEGDKICEGQC